MLRVSELKVVTKILHGQGKNGDRVYVYINNQYCTSVRSRTFDALNVQLDTIISCEELRERESFIFKKKYANTWVREKDRIKYLKTWLKKFISIDFKIEVVGFGADTTDELLEHPKEPDKPDLKLSANGKIAYIEVSGTDHRRGNDFWVREGKVKNIQLNPNDKIWVALVYILDKKIVWISVDKNKHYVRSEKLINEVREYYVCFDEDSNEVLSSSEFKNEIENFFE